MFEGHQLSTKLDDLTAGNFLIASGRFLSTFIQKRRYNGEEAVVAC